MPKERASLPPLSLSSHGLSAFSALYNQLTAHLTLRLRDIEYDTKMNFLMGITFAFLCRYLYKSNYYDPVFLIKSNDIV